MVKRPRRNIYLGEDGEHVLALLQRETGEDNASAIIRAGLEALLAAVRKQPAPPAVTRLVRS